MNKEQREQFLQDNFKLRTLNFKWSKSGVCRIYNLRGENTGFYAGGYGYDKQGTALAELINHYLKDEIKKLNSSKFYGLNHYNTKTKKYNKRANKNTKTSVNGACGFDCMKSILYKIGFEMKFIYESNNNIIYTLNSK